MDEIEELKRQLLEEKEKSFELERILECKQEEISHQKIDTNLELKKSYLKGAKDNSNFILQEVRNIITPAIFHLDHLLQLNEIDKSDESIQRILACVNQEKKNEISFNQEEISEIFDEVKNLKKMVSEKGLLAYKSINKITDVIAYNHIYNESNKDTNQKGSEK